MRGSLPAAGRDFVRYGGHTSCLALTPDGASAPTLILDAGTGLLQRHGAARTARRSTARSCSATCTGTTRRAAVLRGAGDRVDARVSVLLPEQESGTERGASARRADVSRRTSRSARASCAAAGRSRRSRRGEHEIEGFTVLAREIPHKGGRTFGYRVSDGHSSLAYMPDHNPTALGPGADGFGEYHAAALELAGDVDVLVHDAQLLAAGAGGGGRLRSRRCRLRGRARASARARARSRCSTTASTAPTTRSTRSWRGSPRRSTGGQRRHRGRCARPVATSGVRLRRSRQPAGRSDRCPRRVGARARGTPRSPPRSRRHVRRRAAGRRSSRPPRPAP